MRLRRPPRRLTILVTTAALVLLGTGCGGGDDDASSEPQEPGHVTVKDNFFEPGTLKVAAGDTVTWTFRGAVAHNVNGPGFSSKTVKTGNFTHTFAKSGTFNYVCTIHAGMKGKVEVG